MHSHIKIVFTLLSLVWFDLCFAGTPLTPEQTATVKQVLSQVQQHLQHGQASQARSLLEQTANALHSEAIETALILTHMQNGEYSHALSAAAHTQAEHVNIADTCLLYAWLLSIGGQTTFANTLLQENLARFPEHQSLRSMQSLLQGGTWNTAQLPKSEIAKFQPELVNPEKTYLNASIIGSATLLDTTHAVMPYSLLSTKKIWLRNGLGITVAASIEKTFPAQNIALLKLASPIAMAKPIHQADAPPKLGGLAYIVGYVKTNQVDQAYWPILKTDIIGMPNTAQHWTLHVRQFYSGAPVWNDAGALIGITVTSDNGNTEILPIQQMAAAIDLNTESAYHAHTHVSMQDIYEQALSTSLQVMAE
ncbi:MAG: hypothetical protein SFU55_06595 [Methylophilus sp.]|nr:hypothetical protein [Methylophilus sp.]